MKLYRCVYQMGVETALEYRANMVLTLLSTIFPIIIQTFLWNYLYGNGDAGAMTGYSYTEIIVYTLLAGLVSKLVITGFEYQINEDIKDGGLNKYLIRPVNYCGYRFCSYLGEKMPQLILLLICTSVLVAFSSIFLGLELSLVRIVLFLVGLVLAVILNFFIFYCVALLSFWLTDVHLLFGTVSVVLVVVSGGVFPMDIFGKTAALLISLASVRVYDAVSGQHYQWEAFDGSDWHRNAVPACVDRIFLGTGADDVEKRTAALCSGRRLTDGEENWYF